LSDPLFLYCLPGWRLTLIICALDVEPLIHETSSFFLYRSANYPICPRSCHPWFRHWSETLPCLQSEPARQLKTAQSSARTWVSFCLIGFYGPWPCVLWCTDSSPHPIGNWTTPQIHQLPRDCAGSGSVSLFASDVQLISFGRLFLPHPRPTQNSPVLPTSSIRLDNRLTILFSTLCNPFDTRYSAFLYLSLSFSLSPTRSFWFSLWYQSPLVSFLINCILFLLFLKHLPTLPQIVQPHVYLSFPLSC